MDPATALADLTEISSHVEAAVVLDEGGSLLASTLADEARSTQLARTAAELLEAGGDTPLGSARRLTQLEVALREGSVFVARDDERVVAAVVSAGAPAGLVLYDLRSCLRAIEEPKRARARGHAPKSTADA